MSIRMIKKRWRWFALGVVSLCALGLALWAWIVPAGIEWQLRTLYGGKVAIGGWWINGTSAGVKNLQLYEEGEANPPVWASADRLVTDLSIGRILSGRFEPRRIEMQGLQVAFRVDQDGLPLTRLPLGEPPPDQGPLPTLWIRGGRVEIDQEGRPEMRVNRIDAQLEPLPNGDARLSAETDDPFWGHWTASGTFGPGFQTGGVVLVGDDISATLDKVKRIPFVPEEVWDHVQPDGPVAIRLNTDLTPEGPEPVHVVTHVGFLGTTVTLPTLGFTALGTTGELRIEDAVVSIESAQGQALGGAIQTQGRMDFQNDASRFDVTLNLQQIDVAQAPDFWQLGELGLSAGVLEGEVSLNVLLGETLVDLSGTTGTTVVREAVWRGIPVKSMRLALSADGDELQYEMPESVSTSKPSRIPGVGWIALQAMLISESESELGATAQEPPPTPPDDEPPPPPAPTIRLPEAINTEIELEDVDLAEVIDRAKAFGIRVPLGLAGRLSLQARATIPLRTLNELAAYRFQGEATLTQAHVAGVDIGHARANLELVDGTLELSELSGVLISRPDGTSDDPPEPADPVPTTGALPPGGFRGALLAELSPPGTFDAQLEANDVPIEELVAPFLPQPTPLLGRLSIALTANANVETLGQPDSWTLDGSLQGRSIQYRGTTLDALSLIVSMRDKQVAIHEFKARFGDDPLEGSAFLTLEEPFPFRARLQVDSWRLEEILAFIPTAPRPPPVSGLLVLEGEAEGNLSPLELTTQGNGRLGQLRAGVVDLGDVPFEWTSEEDVVLLDIAEARPFGGHLESRTRLPLSPQKPISGTANVKGIDLAQVSALIPDDALTLTGQTDGSVSFSILPKPDEMDVDAAPPLIDLDAKLVAPDLTVQGIPARAVDINVVVQGGTVEYELFAESLGGRIRFRGDFPLRFDEPPEVQGSLHAVGFLLANVWRALGVEGEVANLRGRGAIDANLLAKLQPFDPRASAVFEFRDLTWPPNYRLGWLRGTAGVTPTMLQVSSLTGELLGGSVNGSWRPETSERSRFDLQLNAMQLQRLLAFEPSLAQRARGEATLTLSGTYDRQLRASGALVVPRARVGDLAMVDLRVPTTLTLKEGGRSGTLVLGRWSGRLSGGQFRGNAQFGVGSDPSFQSEMTLGQVDLESIARVLTQTRRPSSGLLSGQLTLSGRDPNRPETYRGRAIFHLDDASLFELPVFREIGLFLGSPRGGIFEDGDLEATIANRRILIEQFNLAGRIIQLHIRGTVGFNGALDLDVLVNTNQLIPQTGEAVLAAIPGFDVVIGDRSQTVRRFNDFLSNRLIKLHVGGTLQNPTVEADPAVVVTDAATGFFAGVLKLPVGLVR